MLMTSPVAFNAGTIVLPDGEEHCQKCYVDGVTLERGTWGATGSGAEHIDDARFAGAGVLTKQESEQQ